MKLKPLQDRVIVKRSEGTEMTKSGIIIPETAKEKPQEGTVVAVGPGKIGDDNERIPLEIKVGDKVLFSKYGPNEVEVDGEEYLMLREDDVWAVIDTKE